VRQAHIHIPSEDIEGAIAEEMEQGTPYYLYGFSSKIPQTNSCLPMYLQMLDEANIRLHHLHKVIGGRLVRRNIDMAIAVQGRQPLEGPQLTLHLPSTAGELTGTRRFLQSCTMRSLRQACGV
jgi:hypothetical protein